MKSFLGVLMLCSSVACAPAFATQLFVNPGFEMNLGFMSTSFSGWATGGTVASDDNFYADSTDDATPLNGYQTVGPNSGAWYAVSDMTGLATPESSYVTQTVTIPVGTTDDMLSFSMFVNDQYGGSGLGGEVAIWASGANPLVDAPIVVVYSADTTVVGGTPNPYYLQSFDVTAYLTAGTAYEIGVLESDSNGPINVGVDDFSLDATSGTVPEPSMLFPAALLAAGMFIYRTRRKART
jgi:hypothetical protein